MLVLVFVLGILLITSSIFLLHTSSELESLRDELNEIQIDEVENIMDNEVFHERSNYHLFLSQYCSAKDQLNHNHISRNNLTSRQKLTNQRKDERQSLRTEVLAQHNLQ